MKKSASRKASNKKARVLSSTVPYRGPVFWVTTDQVLEPSGVRVRRDVVRHSGSVVILAVDDTSRTPRVLLEKQYRHPAGKFLYELPAGRIDEGENELKAGRVAHPFRCRVPHLLSVLVPGVIEEMGAPPFAVFERWESRTRASGLHRFPPFANYAKDGAPTVEVIPR